MKRILYIKALVVAALLLLVTACTVKVPDKFTKVENQPSIFPDNKGVTIPCNIAPLTFYIDDEADEYVTRFTAGSETAVVGGRSVVPSPKQWRALTGAAKGSQIKVEVFACKDGNWKGFAPFTMDVVGDTIDSYISYRLIAPSYVTYEELTINQRNLTNYDESVIYNNMLVSTEKDGQCINCHSYKNWRTNNMQFHVRQYQGGTIMVIDGKVRKINMKNDSTISAGVYPAFNPCYNVIAYSVNNTGQSFHTRDANKIEVQDIESDLILYDYDDNTIHRVATPDTTEFRVFPWWAPDGKTLYYCCAHFQCHDSTGFKEREIIERYQEIKYNIFKKSYNPTTHQFGPQDTVFAASAIGQSATLPRVSPDGRYLLFGMAPYGCFHIWHKQSDLYLMDLANDSVRNLSEINSPDVESYHSWNSTGRWILFTSRRDDGGFTRLYIAYFDKKGNAHKPFEVPQQNPLFYRQFYKSYNVPEFMVEPVTISPQEFAAYVKGKAIKATFKP